MFKIVILSQIGADKYQKQIFRILLLSPLGELCTGSVEYSQKRIMSQSLRSLFSKFAVWA